MHCVQVNNVKKRSPKSYAVSVCLSGIFGVFGIQHFYLERWLEGILDAGLSILALYYFLTGHFLLAIITFSIDCLHSLVVTILLLTGSFKDGKGRYVCYPGQILK